MSDYIHPIIQFTEQHAGLVYVLAFVATFFESVAVIGLVVPGSAIIVALGALVPSGAVGFWWLCFWSILGALSGDGLSYWIGYRHKPWLKRLWPFRRYPEALAHGERFFAAHGGKSVFLSRFVAPVRGTVPLVAGMAEMSPGRFLVFCALSALGWAPTHVLPGVLIGAGLTLTDAIATRLLVVVVILAAFLWLSARGAAFSIHHGRRLLAAFGLLVERWASRRETWLARQATAMLDPDRNETRVLAVLCLVLISAAWIFFGVLEDVLSGDPLVHADMAIYQMLQDLRSLAVDRLMIAITELGGSVVGGAITLIVLLFMLWRRAWHAAAYWLAAVGGAALIGLVIKAALHRPRPTQIYAGWDAFSFPSGHATTSAAIYGFLAVLIARKASPTRQALAAAIAALMIGLIGFSRLYLGAHWFSDVLGGIAFGTTWIALLAIAYVRHNPPHFPTRVLAAIVAVTLAGTGVVQIARKMPADLERYAVRSTVRTMTATAWWRAEWRQVPARRVDLVGEREEPLILQWAGGIESLQSRLEKDGWRSPMQWSVPTALRWMDPSTDPLTLPVLPRLHDGRTAALTLVLMKQGRAHADTRWVLRIWKSEFQVTARNRNPQAIWIGAITQQRIHVAFAPFDLGFEKPMPDVPMDALLPALGDAQIALRADGKSGIRLILAHDPKLPVS